MPPIKLPSGRACWCGCCCCCCCLARRAAWLRLATGEAASWRRASADDGDESSDDETDVETLSPRLLLLLLVLLLLLLFVVAVVERFLSYCVDETLLSSSSRAPDMERLAAPESDSLDCCFFFVDVASLLWASETFSLTVSSSSSLSESARANGGGERAATRRSVARDRSLPLPASDDDDLLFAMAPPL